MTQFGMTKLSVNINKIALLRNSRGRDYPSVVDFSRQFLELGAHGITLHPRPDERHAKATDALALRALTTAMGKELNIEGYPDERFIDMVLDVHPDQCTLVPDSPDQITSDHGWDLTAHQDSLRIICQRLTDAGIRVSLFVNGDDPDVAKARDLGAHRVELYTEPYAETYGQPENQNVLEQFKHTAERAIDAGLEINAGHDLNLDNLALFVSLPNISEVSIGHALIVECLQFGIEATMGRYMAILK